MTACPVSSARSAPDTFEVLRYVDGTEFLLCDAPGRIRSRVQTHAIPIVCLLLKGAMTEVDDRARVVERGPLTINLTPIAYPHAHGLESERVTTLCFDIAPPIREILGEDCDVFGQYANVRTGPATSLIPRFHREMLNSDKASDLILQGLILELAGLMKRRTGSRIPTDAPSWLRKAREMIHDQCSESFGITEVARAVGIHPSHLARVFRHYLNESPGEYLRRIRMDRATREVLLTSSPLKEIAERAGFSDPAHFSREFRKAHGSAPLEFRLMARA